MQKMIEKEKTYNLPDEHRQVLNVIRNTSKKYITKTKILNQLGYEYNSSNERWLRKVINSLVYDYAYPIGVVINVMNVVITLLQRNKRSNKQWLVLKS